MKTNHLSLIGYILHICYFISLILPAWSSDFDQSSFTDDLKCRLIKNGFENVSIFLEDNHLIVAYENRIYRDEMKAMREVVAIISPSVKEVMSITLIAQNRNIPIVSINIPANDRKSFDVSLDVDSAWRKIQATQKANSSFHKLDIVIHPQFIASFGNMADPVESQINIVPEFTTSLWKGMSLSAQLIIPLQNELEEEGDYWRPGLLTINQTFRLPRNIFTSATLGYFTEDRYGIDLEFKKYFANGRWSVGANAGYTGYSYYLKRVWYYANPDLLTAYFNVAYRFSRYDLTLSATYGRFLYKDKGWRLDILRQFGEVDIGFFALKTETGTNAGFNFSIPIFPSKYLTTKRIRVSPAKEFPWEYRYKGLPNSGIRYKTGYSINGFMKKLNFDYFKNYVIIS